MSKLKRLHDRNETLINPEELTMAYAKHDRGDNGLFIYFKNGTNFILHYEDYCDLLDDLNSLYM